jgi:uncharacterized protein with HEPN domain
MSLSRLGDYLDQMLTAANDARRFVDGMSKEDFLADKRTQQAGDEPRHYRRGRRQEYGQA